MESTERMSKILAAMKKSSADQVDLSERLRMIDRGNLYPLPPESQVREFEQLANSLINLHESDTGQSVVFSSTYRGEGSSYVSYNCARYISTLVNRKVAWIDCDFQNPNKKLQNNTLTLKGMLLDPQSVPSLDKDPELVVVGNGPQSAKVMDLLKGPNLRTVLRRLEESCYFVILDAGPIMDSVEVAHLAQDTLGMILVIQSNRLKYEVVQHGLDRLRDHNVDILGTVLNKRTFHIPEFIYKRL